jgi:hypothetical protein
MTVNQGRKAKGGHGLPNISLGLAMPYPLHLTGGHFRGSRPQSGGPAAIFLPPWIPHAVRLCCEPD